MTGPGENTDRLIFFSDGVFAIIITVLVLELRPPHEASFEALMALWPSAVAYAVSYLFLAIVWMNHHHLMRFASQATDRLAWTNFGHLFSVSIVPFATAWVADSHLAGLAVAFYAFVFSLVNLTYMALCMEAVDKQGADAISGAARRFMRLRSIITCVVFAAAVGVAFAYPVGGIVLIVACLILYARPGSAQNHHPIGS